MASFRTGALLSRSPVKLSPMSDPRYICLYCRNNRLRHSFRPVSEINTLLPAYMLNLFLYIVALLSIAAVLIAAPLSRDLQCCGAVFGRRSF